MKNPIVRAVSNNGDNMKNKKIRKFIRLPNGKKISKTFDRLTDAKNWHSLAMAEKKRNAIYGTEMPLKKKLKDVVGDWFKLKEKTIEERSLYEYNAILSKHILPEFGERYLTELRKIDAERFIVKLADTGLSNSRIEKIYILLKGIITYALHHQFLMRDPFIGIKLPKIKDKQRDFLEKEDVNRLLEYALKNDRAVYGVVLITLNTGLRLGEVIGLHWSQIDFQRRRINVTKKATRFGIQEYAKHGKHRTVFMSDTVFNYLKNLQIQQPFQTLVFNDDGVPLSYEHFKQRRFDKIVEQAGLRKIRFHTLRHTYASHFVMSGGRIQELQPLLGHSDIKTTMIYAHISESHLEKLASVVEFGKNQISEHQESNEQTQTTA